MKMGIDGKPEDLLKDEQPNGGENEKESRNEKPTLRSRLESFWYFYKWHTLLGALLLFGLIISIVQFVRNVGPDAYIMYVGPSTLYVKDKDSMAAQASEYVTDHNYDNKKHVAFLDITVAVGENIPYTAYQTNVDANKRFIAELSAGDSVIYLLEESFFEIANEQGLLCPLDQIVDPNELPDNMYDKCAVRVGDLDFFKREGFSSVPDDTLLCIRRRPDDPERRESAYWYNNEKIVRNMLLYKSEQSEPKPAKAFDNGKNDVVLGIYDVNRHYVSDGKKLAYAASSILKDANSDGMTLLAVDAVLLNGKNDADAYLRAQIAEGGEVIFIADAEYYAKLKSSGILRPLGHIIGKYAERLGSADGYALQLKQLKWFDEKQYFKDFNKDLYICIAYPRGDGEKDGFYKANAEFFKEMALYKADEEQK